MLPAEHRLRRSQEFRRTVRRGARGGRPLVVVHVAAGPEAAAPALAGFVVSGAVGGAVARNLVRRRLRHLMRDRIGRVPAGSRVVVRAQPGSAEATSHALAADLDAALAQALARLEARR